MDYGKRLLPQVVDHLAATEPSRIYASIPKSPMTLDDGFHDVSMVDLASMVNRMAWWIETTIGKGNLEALAYIGATDIRYAIMLLASIKTGYKILFISSRNQVQQNGRMLQTVQCKALFYADELTPVAEVLKNQQPDLTTALVPALEDLYTTAHTTEQYTYTKTFEEARDLPCLVLHSSGSTGDPKLVTMTHGTFSVTDNDRNVAVPEGRAAQNGSQFNFQGGGKYYSCFPPYHLAGVHAYITLPIFSTSATVVFSPSKLPPSGFLLSEILKHQHVDAFYVPPFIIEQWAAEEVSDEQAKQLKFILYGGGPLSPSTGERLSKVTHVCQMYGSLEAGQIQLLVPQEGEWSYMELNPYEECDMQDQNDGTFEMVLHYADKFVPHRSLPHNFPGRDVWNTGDLFTPHPSKAGLWRFQSRKDDLIVFSSSHKLLPGEMETIIQGSPLVAGVLIVGQGRPQPLLIVEFKPAHVDAERSHLINEIQPLIDQANAIAPSYGRLSQSYILFASPDKPFIRAPKGTVVRKLTTKAYEEEIEAAYQQNTVETATSSSFTGQAMDQFLLAGIEMWVTENVKRLLPGIEISPTDNLFILGLDSLRSAELSRSLQRACSALTKNMNANSAVNISLRMIYEFPTIKDLSNTIFQALFYGVSHSTLVDKKKEIEAMVEQLTKTLPGKNDKQPTDAASNGTHAVLIGPRGSVGPHVLRGLLDNPDVSKVYCLNRGEDGRQRMAKEFQNRSWKWGTEADADYNDRVVFMATDFSKPALGLSQDDYTEILTKANLILHNAWKVDFSWTLDSYKEQHLRSVLELIDISSKSALSPRLVFISSISSVQEWASVYSTPVTEDILPCYEVASPLGYGQSKHASERILAEAAKESGVPVTILRLGQVAGPTVMNGVSWSTDEWIPSLAAVSKTLNLVPTDLPPIDWVPVDVASKALVELSLTPTTDSAELQVYNVVNPRLVDWSLFATAIEQRLGDSARRVTLTEWVQALVETDPATMSEAEAAASTKILPFFQHLAETAAGGITLQPKFDTTKAQGASATMAAMQAISPELIQLWLTQWGI